MSQDLSRRPSSPSRPVGTTRPEGALDYSVVARSGAEGRPPLVPFCALASCFLLSAIAVLIGKSSNLFIPEILGFIVGSFLSVVALAWFIVQDNTNRSLPYRDWRVSARTLAPWILLGSWLSGTGSVFLIALDMSRSFVE